jgi:hypothetical protein
LVLLDVEEVDDLLMPEGVVIVLDLLIVPELLLMVDDFDIPAGLVIVLDFVVTFVPGWVVLVVVVFELLLIVPVAAGVVAGVWAWATEAPSRLRERRKPKMRFINI